MVDIKKRNQGSRNAYEFKTVSNLTSLLYKHKNSNRCGNCRYDGDCPVVEDITQKLKDLQAKIKANREFAVCE